MNELHEPHWRFEMIHKNEECKEEYKADALAIFWILIIFYAFACVREKKFISFHICFITNFLLPLPIKTIKPNLNIQIYTHVAAATKNNIKRLKKGSVRSSAFSRTYNFVTFAINRRSKIIYRFKIFFIHSWLQI